MTTRRPSAPESGGSTRHYDELARRHALELRLADVAAGGGGISGLVRTAAELTPNPLWLVDTRGRVVSRSTQVQGSDFRPPDPEALLSGVGPVDLSAPDPVVVPPNPTGGVTRRHLLTPVARTDVLFAWLVVAEVSCRFRREEVLTQRTAFHLAGEYAVQRRVAQASWNARSALARQLVRGSSRQDDLLAASEYLGVRADADRVLVYLPDTTDEEPRDEEHISDMVARELGTEVLGTRGRDGTMLLVEVPDDAAHVSFVHQVKGALAHVVAQLGEPDTTVGVSSVSRPEGLERAYRETREVVLCVDRFARGDERVIAVDDLGPARLFVANSDVGAVRRYVRDVLGSLLGQASGQADLLRTLQAFFDCGRSVRTSAARLGIHENTVRLRLAKVQDLTGLDVAAEPNDQLSAQTALLVLRLEGHASVPPFAERHAPDTADNAPLSREEDSA